MTKEKSNIYEMAEKLGVKKENLEVGLKEKPKETEKMIKDAYNFRFKGK